jgi:hypothetical protein
LRFWLAVSSQHNITATYPYLLMLFCSTIYLCSDATLVFWYAIIYIILYRSYFTIGLLMLCCSAIFVFWPHFNMLVCYYIPGATTQTNGCTIRKPLRINVEVGAPKGFWHYHYHYHWHYHWPSA